jgi:hypothetical protein
MNHVQEEILRQLTTDELEYDEQRFNALRRMVSENVPNTSRNFFTTGLAADVSSTDLQSWFDYLIEVEDWCTDGQAWAAETFGLTVPQTTRRVRIDFQMDVTTRSGISEYELVRLVDALVRHQIYTVFEGEELDQDGEDLHFENHGNYTTTVVA